MADIDERKLAVKEIGDALAADGDFVKALATYTVAHEEEPSASSGGGKRLLMSMKKAQGKVQVQNTAAATTEAEKGERLRDEKDFVGSLEALRRGLRIEVKDAALIDRLTTGLQRTDMAQETEAHHQFEEGQEAILTKDAGAAVYHFENALQLRPKDPVLVSNLPAALEAAKAMRGTLEEQLKQAQQKYDEGQAAAGLNQYHYAIEAYHTALGLEINQKLLVKKLQRALEQAEQAQKLQLQNRKVAHDKFDGGQEAHSSQNLAAAMALYKEALAIDTDDKELTSFITDALANSETAAAEALQQLRTDADLAVDAEDWTVAVQLLTKAGELAPGDKKLALLLKKSESKLGTKNVPAFNSLLLQGQTAMAADMFDAALDYFSAAQNLHVNDAKLEAAVQHQIEDVPKAAAVYLYQKIATAEHMLTSGAIENATATLSTVLQNTFVNDSIKASVDVHCDETMPLFDTAFASKEYMRALHIHTMITTLSPTTGTFSAKVQEMTKDMCPIGDAAFNENEFEVAVGAFKLGLLYNKTDKKLILALKKAEKRHVEEAMAAERIMYTNCDNAVALFDSGDASACAEIFEGLLQSRFVNYHTDKTRQSVTEIIQLTADKADALFTECIMATNYLQAFAVHKVAVLRFDSVSIKERAQTMTKDMKKVGDKAYKDEKFDMAVGAYKLGMLYNEDDRRLALALKKAEKKQLEGSSADGQVVLARCEEARAIFDAGNTGKCSEILSDILKQGLCLEYRLHRTTPSVSETITATIAKAVSKFFALFDANKFLKALDVHTMITTLSPEHTEFKNSVQEMTKDMRPIGDAAVQDKTFDIAIGAYRLGLLYNESDRRLVLALKKVEVKYGQEVASEVMEWMVTQTEVADAKEKFEEAFATQEYLRANESLDFIIRADGNDEAFRMRLEYFMTPVEARSSWKDIGDTCFRDWQYANAVGAYTLGLFRNPGDKALALALKKAERKYTDVGDNNAKRSANSLTECNTQIQQWISKADGCVNSDNFDEATAIYLMAQNHTMFAESQFAQSIETKCKELDREFDVSFRSDNYLRSLAVHKMVTTLSPNYVIMTTAGRTDHKVAFKDKVQDLTKDMRPLGDAALNEEKYEISIGAYRLGLLYNDGDKRLTLSLKKAESKYAAFQETQAKLKAEQSVLAGPILEILMAEGKKARHLQKFKLATAKWTEVQNHDHPSADMLYRISKQCEEVIPHFESCFAVENYMQALDVCTLVISLSPGKSYSLSLTDDKGTVEISDSITFKENVQKMTKGIKERGDAAFKENKFEMAVGAYKLGLLFNEDDMKLALALKKAENKYKAFQELEANKKAELFEKSKPLLNEMMADAAESYTNDRCAYATMKWSAVQNHEHVNEQMLTTISQKCDGAAEKFDEAFASTNLIRAHELHALVTTLSADTVDFDHFKQRAKDMTKDMRQIGDTAIKEENFEIAVGAYRLGLLYKDGDKRLVLALKKAEKQLREQTRVMGQDRAQASAAFYEAIQVKSCTEAWRLYQIAFVDPHHVDDQAFKTKSQEAIYELCVKQGMPDMKAIGDEYLNRTDLTDVVATLQTPDFDMAIAAYQLGLVYQEDDKKLLLALKKAEKQFVSYQEKWAAHVAGCAASELLQDLVRRVEVADAHEHFERTYSADDFLAASDIHTRLVADGWSDAAFTSKALELTQGIRDKGDMAVKAGADKDRGTYAFKAYAAQAVGAYRLAQLSDATNKKLLLALKKAEKLYSSILAEEQEQRLGSEMMIKEGEMRLEVGGSRSMEWKKLWMRLLDGGIVNLYDKSPRHVGLVVSGMLKIQRYSDATLTTKNKKVLVEWEERFLRVTSDGLFTVQLNDPSKRRYVDDPERAAVVLEASCAEITAGLPHGVDKKDNLKLRKASVFQVDLKGETLLVQPADSVEKDEWIKVLRDPRSLPVKEEVFDSVPELASAPLLKTFKCSDCDVGLLKSNRPEALFAFKIGIFAPNEDGELELTEKLVVEPFPANEVTLQGWMDIIKAPPEPMLPPDTPTDEEVEVKCGFVKVGTRKSRLKKLPSEQWWYKLVTGGTLYAYSNDTFGSKPLQIFQCSECTFGLPTTKENMGKNAFTIKLGKELYTIESANSQPITKERDAWLTILKEPPARTVGIVHKLKQIAYPKYSKQSDTHYEAGDWAATVEACKNALHIYPDNVHSKRQMRDALDHIQKSVDNEQVDEDKRLVKAEQKSGAMRKLEEGNKALVTDDVVQAIKLYKEGVELDSDNKRLQLAIKKAEKAWFVAHQQKGEEVQNADKAADLANEEAFSVQEAAIDKMEEKLGQGYEIDEDLLWPFTNLVKHGWVRVQCENGWERHWFRLIAGGTLEIYEDAEEKMLSNFEGTLTTEEGVLSTGDCRPGLTKKPRADAPHAFRIDYTRRQPNKNRASDGKLVVECVASVDVETVKVQLESELVQASAELKRLSSNASDTTTVANATVFELEALLSTSRAEAKKLKTERSKTKSAGEGKIKSLESDLHKARMELAGTKPSDKKALKTAQNAFDALKVKLNTARPEHKEHQKNIGIDVVNADATIVGVEARLVEAQTDGSEKKTSANGAVVEAKSLVASLQTKLATVAEDVAILAVDSRDEWILLIVNTPERVEDGPELDDERKQKRIERKEALVEKWRMREEMNKSQAVLDAVDWEAAVTRRLQEEHTQILNDAEKDDYSRRTALARSDDEWDTFEDQRLQKEFHISEGERLVSRNEFDRAVEEYIFGLNTDWNDPHEENEVLSGWVRIREDKEPNGWTKEFFRLVEGGVIHRHSDDTGGRTDEQQVTDLTDEYLVKEGPIQIENGKGWDSHWLQMKSGGALYFFPADPNPVEADAAIEIKRGPVRVKRYFDKTLETQSSDWIPSYYILMANGVVNVYPDDPSKSVYKREPERCQLQESFQCNECNIVPPRARQKEFLKMKILPIQIDQADDTLLIESTTKMPSDPAEQKAWTEALLPLATKGPIVHYLRLGSDQYEISDVKPIRKNAPLAFRIDSTGGRNIIVDPTSASEQERWLAMCKRPPPVRVTNAMASMLKIQRYEDATLETIVTDWEERFLTVASNGVFTIRLNDPLKRRYIDSPEGAAIDMETNCDDLEAGPPHGTDKKKNLKLRKDSIFQIDMTDELGNDETLLVQSANNTERDEWIKLLKDPLSNPFEEQAATDFAATDDNRIGQFRCRRCVASVPSKPAKGGPGILFLRDRAVNYVVAPLPSLDWTKLEIRDKWVDAITDWPKQKNIYLGKEFNKKLEEIPVLRENWERKIAALELQAKLDADEEDKRKREAWEAEEITRLDAAVDTAVVEDTKLVELEEKKLERQQRKEGLEEKKKQREIDKLLQEEAKIEEKKLVAEKKRKGEEALQQEKLVKEIERMKLEEEREQRLHQQSADTEAENGRMELFYAHRKKHDQKYYCGWLKVKDDGGTNQMWCVINHGCLQLWKEKDGVDIFQTWVWETYKPNRSMSLLAVRQLRAFHDEGTVIKTKKVKDTGFLIADDFSKWHIKTADDDEADRWVKWLSVSRCIAAARSGLTWMISNPKTLHISYKFYTEKEQQIVISRQEAEDKRIEDEKQQLEADEKKRREELVASNATMLEEKKQSAEAHRRKVETEAKLAKRAHMKKHDKVIYSFPPEDQFDLSIQPFSILIPALPIIRAKVGWLMHKTGREEMVNGKNKMVFKMRRFFVVMWRHPQQNSGGYDIIKYETDDDRSNDGPIDIVYLRGMKVSATEEGSEKHPGKFAVRTQLGSKKGAITEEMLFDASTADSAAAWVDFVLYGPSFTEDFSTKVDEEMRAKQAEIDAKMRQEAIAERGRRAAADLKRRQTDVAEQQQAPGRPGDDAEMFFDPREDRDAAKELQKEAKDCDKAAKYHEKLAKAAKNRGQMVSYQDEHSLYEKQMGRAKDLRNEAERLLDRAKESEKPEAKQKKTEVELERKLKAEAAMEAEIEQMQKDVEDHGSDVEEELGEEDEEDPAGDLMDNGFLFGKGDGSKVTKKANKIKKNKMNKKITETWHDSKDVEVMNPLADMSGDEEAFDEMEVEQDRYQIEGEGWQSRGLINKSKKAANKGIKMKKKAEMTAQKIMILQDPDEKLDAALDQVMDGNMDKRTKLNPENLSRMLSTDATLEAKAVKSVAEFHEERMEQQRYESTDEYRLEQDRLAKEKERAKKERTKARKKANTGKGNKKLQYLHTNSSDGGSRDGSYDAEARKKQSRNGSWRGGDSVDSMASADSNG
jgi:hypothetical protein